MEIDKTLLQTMIREFWSVNNNDLCENVTILFLRKIGLSDNDITRIWLDIRESIKSRDFSEAQERLDEAIKDTKNYFNEEV